MEKVIVQRLYELALKDYINALALTESAKVNIGAMKITEHNLGYYEGMCVAYGIILGKSYKDFQKDVKEEESKK